MDHFSNFPGIWAGHFGFFIFLLREPDGANHIHHRPWSTPGGYPWPWARLAVRALRVVPAATGDAGTGGLRSQGLRGPCQFGDSGMRTCLSSHLFVVSMRVASPCWTTTVSVRLPVRAAVIESNTAGVLARSERGYEDLGAKLLDKHA